jgi:hypothetical protein
MRTSDFLGIGIKGQLVHRADNLTAICELIVWKTRAPGPVTDL